MREGWSALLPRLSLLAISHARTTRPYIESESENMHILTYLENLSLCLLAFLT
jgi:hypothetical protein